MRVLPNKEQRKQEHKSLIEMVKAELGREEGRHGAPRVATRRTALSKHETYADEKDALFFNNNTDFICEQQAVLDIMNGLTSAAKKFRYFLTLLAKLMGLMVLMLMLIMLVPPPPQY